MEMKQPKVTVLTAARNAGCFLSQTIECIRSQTFPDWEYIVVDDASEDDTVQVVEQMARQDQRLRLLQRSSQGGPFAAANDGLREARGEYIVRIDADDLSPAHRIERQVAFLESNTEYKACITPWQSFNKHGLIPGSISPIPTQPPVIRWYLLLTTPGSHSSLCIKRSTILDIGGYRELPATQDFRLLSMLSRRGWLAVMPEVLSFLRRHENRISKHTGALQMELAIDVMAEHLAEIASESWSREDLQALWLVGHSGVFPVKNGLRILDRWDGLWRCDTELSQENREELTFFSALHRWKFLRTSLRSQTTEVILNLPSLLPTGLRLIVPRGRVTAN